MGQSYLILLLCTVVALTDGKHVSVSLQSNWEYTPLHLEISEFMAHESNDLFWKFADNIRALPKEASEEDHYNSAIKTAQNLTSSIQQDSLKFSLSLRSFSPAVQAFRQLFSAFLGDMTSKMAEKAKSCSSFVYVGGIVACTSQEFEDTMRTAKGEAVPLKDFDHIYPGTQGPTQAILFGSLGSSDFTELHQLLKERAASGDITYVFRHLVPHAETKLPLGGYGAELAIKSLEYKAVDDSKVEGGETKEVAIEENEQEIQGISFGTLQKRKPELASELANFKAYLLAKDEHFEDLKVWALKDLGFQAAQRVMSAGNPLRLLRDISHNFPTHAVPLSRVKVNETLKADITNNTPLEPGKNLLLINGRVTDLDTLDAFSVYSVLTEESEKLDAFVSLGYPPDDAFAMMSTPLQRDAGYTFEVATDEVIFFNDLEKDAMYSQWRDSVNDIFQRVWPGSFRFIAKNFYTVVVVLNPAEPGHMIHLLQNMINQNFPIRFGILLATTSPAEYKDSVAKAADGQEPEIEVTDAVRAARIVHYLRAKFGATRQVITFLATLANTQGNVQMAFNTAMQQTGSHSNNFEEVVQDTKYDENIRKNNKYLMDHGLYPAPLAFMNGVPCSAQSPNELYNAIVNQYFTQSEKMQMLVRDGVIRNGDNIYEKLMSQPNVLSRYNFMILPSENNPLRYVPLAVRGSAKDYIESIQYDEVEDTPKSITTIVSVDLATRKGRELALQALSHLRQKDTSMTRVGLLHNTAEDPKSNSALLSKAIVAAYASQLRTRSSEFVLRLLQDAVSEGSEITEKWILDKATENSVRMEKFEPAFRSAATIETISNQRELAKVGFGLRHGQPAAIVNGRLLDLSDADFIAEDFHIVNKVEGRRGDTIHHRILAINFRGVEADQIDAKFLSGTIMKTVSLLGIDEAKSLQKLVFQSKSSLTLKSSSDPEYFRITAILDPLSVPCQRILPILEAIYNAFNVKLDIVFNPTELSALPLKNFYAYAHSSEIKFQNGRYVGPTASFSSLPLKRLLTLHIDSPDSWLLTPTIARYDLDNIKLEQLSDRENVLYAEYELQHIVLQGNCYERTRAGGLVPPRGLQVVLGRWGNSTSQAEKDPDTTVMSNFGYFQLKSNPGIWQLKLKENSRSELLYKLETDETPYQEVAIMSFVPSTTKLMVRKKEGKEQDQLLSDEVSDQTGSWSMGGLFGTKKESDDTIHVFSLASGHLYERFLKIMMLSVVQHTKNPVKFWLLANFLSPKFKDFIPQMAAKYNFEYELVTYHWPSWLHQQTEKQRVIWGYKILFLDVLFPLDLKKVIYVDADQVVKADLKELWDMNLGGAPYAYTPFCSDNHATDGFRFWNQGFWQNHLGGKPYHISALYVVDLVQFRKLAAGDQLRATYDQLSQDPNSLANLDQDLPNYLQGMVKIHSLPQEWLWCETWCSQESKSRAKTIDLCNNPLTKTPKLEAAVKIIPEWTDMDNEIKALEREVSSNTTLRTTAVPHQGNGRTEL